jgi:hypothetical protein
MLWLSSGRVKFQWISKAACPFLTFEFNQNMIRLCIPNAVRQQAALRFSPSWLIPSDQKYICFW